jgi:hypothetical protein
MSHSSASQVFSLSRKTYFYGQSRHFLPSNFNFAKTSELALRSLKNGSISLYPSTDSSDSTHESLRSSAEASYNGAAASCRSS